MNPNSAHQLWSKWTIVVRPDSVVVPDFETVRLNAARFLRKAFGSTTSMRLRQFPKAWVIEVLTESSRHPDDRGDFLYLARACRDFFCVGFGLAADVRVKARLMAGPRMDGGAPDQLIVLPTIPIHA